MRQGKVGQGYKFASVGSRFKRQLGELMEALHAMEPHYIRCIKPNSFNRCALLRTRRSLRLHALLVHRSIAALAEAAGSSATGMALR